MVDARPGQRTAPIQSRQNLDVANAGEAPHQLRMMRHIVVEPDIHVFGRPGIVDKIAAGESRRLDASVVDGKRTHAHSLLRRPRTGDARQHTRCGKRLQMAGRRQRRLHVRQFVEIELEAKDRRWAILVEHVRRHFGQMDVCKRKARRRCNHPPHGINVFTGDGQICLAVIMEESKIGKAHLDTCWIEFD
jgi:hypothetical protein